MAYTTIDDPSKYFQTKIYTGTNNELVLTFDGDSDLQPDMIWTKNRGRAANHVLSDTVRGIGKGLYPDLANAEGDTNYISAIGSDGYTIVATDSVEINRDDDTFVSWNWKESATAGFDILTYTGNDTNRTISHSLSAVPHWILIKATSRSDSWRVYHHKNTSAPATDYLTLNETDATSDNATEFQDTVPTSSVFTLGTSGNVNRNSETFVAYLWSEKKGFSKFGSYTGNGNANGVFIYTGFKPAMVITKRTDGAADWFIRDNKQNPHNVMNEYLSPNTNATSGNLDSFDFVSNGFKIRNSNNAWNGDGNSYVYMAFAENPFVTSTGIPATAR